MPPPFRCCEKSLPFPFPFMEEIVFSSRSLEQFALLFHWLHPIWCYSWFHIEYIYAPLAPQDLDSEDLVIVRAQPLRSPPSLPPPAPGTHSVFVEELSCWTLWISSQWDKNVPWFPLSSRPGWATRIPIRGVREAVGLGCCSGVPGEYTVGSWRKMAFLWQAKFVCSSFTC